VTCYHVQFYEFGMGKGTEQIGCKIFDLSVLSFGLGLSVYLPRQNDRNCLFYTLDKSVFSTV
jgi:hypothetical protein